MSKRGPANKFGYRAVAGGIGTNAYMKDTGKGSYRFDPRSTEQANETRSEVNEKAQQEPMRKAAWDARRADARVMHQRKKAM
jgi:hypothetical protein